MVYLNGAYASQPSWRPVIAELGAEWRHITYDERARGKSNTAQPAGAGLPDRILSLAPPVVG